MVGVSGPTDAHTLAILCSMEELSGSVMVALRAFIPMVYWEGAVVAMGTRNGAPVADRGFVEMVGYAPSILSRICTPLSTGPATKGNRMLQNSGKTLPAAAAGSGRAITSEQAKGVGRWPVST